MNFRKADLSDREYLGDLAYGSKSFWGYNQDFLESCREDLEVTEEEIKNDLVYILEENGKTLGFYLFSYKLNELDALFIDRDYIQKGYGKVLWEHLILELSLRGIREFGIVADPNAAGFYRRMGAKEVRKVQSLRDRDRKLVLFEYKME